jgi:hypothetical protein
MTDPRFRPDDPDGVLHDRIQFAAWAGLLQWLAGQDWALAEFAAGAGHAVAMERPRAAIERMIDQAGGYDPRKDALTSFPSFVRWATCEHWGEAEITPSIQAALDRLPVEMTT